jgi:ElaB/YqjD/DUF883 family membrane-anchored ribosome-binding protein
MEAYMESNGQYGSTRDRLLDDLKLILRDAEDLLRSTSQQAGDGYQVARAKFESTMGMAKENLSDVEQIVAENTRVAMENTDRYVKENPWQAVGVGALAGLVVGLIVGRR